MDKCVHINLQGLLSCVLQCKKPGLGYFLQVLQFDIRRRGFLELEEGAAAIHKPRKE